MSNIALFCDGTWNSPLIAQPTHVWRLYDACAETDVQVCRYFEGVGVPPESGRFRTWLGRMTIKVGGGAFGWGLEANIKAAYKALCEVYLPGDKVFIFGFSRGAYTARSMGGMIRKCGILAEPTDANVDTAFRLYKRAGPENAPDEPHIWEARRRLSPMFATSQKDIEMRGDDSYMARIAYMGIWDTVGALGIPTSLLGPVASYWNRRYLFHDTMLSSMVESARHVVALDERRKFYEPSLWNNLDATEKHRGLNQGDEGPDRPYQQVWFIGNHGIVGGSATARAISAITLDWIWEGARAQGLLLDADARIPDVDPDPVFATDEIYRSRSLYKVARNLLSWRSGPERDWHLHASARLRAEKDTSYRPESLKGLLKHLWAQV